MLCLMMSADPQGENHRADPRASGCHASRRFGKLHRASTFPLFQLFPVLVIGRSFSRDRRTGSVALGSIKLSICVLTLRHA